MKIINLDNIIRFHTKIENFTGGATGIREQSLIESSLNRCKTTFDGTELYPDIEMKIAVTSYSLIKNHSFTDGNKRIGINTLLLLSHLNGIKLKYEQEEIVDLALGVAEGNISESEIKQWIIDHKIMQ